MDLKIFVFFLKYSTGIIVHAIFSLSVRREGGFGISCQIKYSLLYKRYRKNFRNKNTFFGT